MRHHAFLVLLMLSFAAPLSGCGVAAKVENIASSMIDQPTAPDSATGAPDRIDTINFAAAYCEGDAATALATTRQLIAAHPTDLRIRLIYGMALDLAGHGVAAYRTLAPLADGNSTLPVALKCGQHFVYSGALSDVAQRRLFEIRTRLAALGVIFPLPSLEETYQARRDLYAFAGTAPTRVADVVPPTATTISAGTPTTASAPPDSAERSAVPEPTRKPARHSERHGGHARRFVHLDSYRSMKSLERGWRILERRYGKVLRPGRKTVTHVDLGSRGRFLRLGVAVRDDAVARRICRQLKPHGQYCAILPLGKS